MQIPAPESQGLDIYGLGFDRTLNRIEPPEDKSNAVYDVITDDTIQANKKIVTTGGITSKRVADEDGTNITINWASGNVHSVTLGGNRTIKWTGQEDGQVCVVSIRQPSTGTASITWPGTVSWPSGTTPTLTYTAGKTDVFVFVRHNADNKEYANTVGANY